MPSLQSDSKRREHLDNEMIIHWGRPVYAFYVKGVEYKLYCITDIMPYAFYVYGMHGMFFT